jgi:hypothetical protein
VGSALGRLLGRPNPVKTGAGGRLQPYDPSTGRYLASAANPGVSPGQTTTNLINLMVGAAQGYADGAFGIQAPIPGTRAHDLGQKVGKSIAALENLFR